LDSLCKAFSKILRRPGYDGDAYAILKLQIPASGFPHVDKNRTGHRRETSGNARHILRVDSDADFHGDVTRFLVEHYDSDLAREASTAFKMAREKTPAIVLVNVMSAGVDGVDLVRNFRKDEQLSLVPIILYSSTAGKDLCIEGLESGANDYLITPYSCSHASEHSCEHLRCVVNPFVRFE
jgi:PleD family two-component response regulator